VLQSSAVPPQANVTEYVDASRSSSVVQDTQVAQHVVDPEVAIWLECNAGTICAALGKGCLGFTNQRREDAGVAVQANGVASAQQQTSAVDMDTPVDLHVRRESGDHPDLAGRLDPADNVPVHD